MKKFYTFFAIVVVLNIILLFVGGKPEQVASSKKAPVKVGLVFDVGGRGDKSFNDSAYNGLQRAIKELGADAQYFEPGEGSDRESSLRRLASQDFDLIIGVGFIFTDDIAKMAKEYPNKKFAGVDYVVIDPPPPNVAALKFREEEGSFLVGALAALLTKTNKIGFVGGMDIPLIHKFEEGYKQGAKTANPQIQVVSNYAGVTGAAFKDPAKGKELALSQYGNGVDIIFHASGSTGLGVFEAARNLNKLAIGVDSDQFNEAPGFILTSMVKKVDVAVFEIIRDIIQNKYTGGVKEFGLKQDGVGYVYDDNNKMLIPEDVHKKVEELRKKIISGEIKVAV
jgi:basic membrane protein A